MPITDTLPPDKPLAVAFSGGSDSLALLWMVHGMEKVSALYVNHHIRPQAELEREIALNRANCEKLGVPFFVLDVDPGELWSLAKEMGMEGAARTLRYRLLLAWCAQHGATLLVAHTRDDQRENVLFRMTNGAPESHLSIAPEREIGGVRILRPLMGFTHEELRSLLSSHSLCWSEDSTNQDCGIGRNQVRHVLLPALSREYPLLGEMLDAVASFSLSLRSFIETQIACVDCSAPLSRVLFLSLAPFARNELLFRYLGGNGRVPLRFVDHIRLLLEGPSQRWVERYGETSLLFENGCLRAIRREDRPCFCYGGDILLKGGEISIPSVGRLCVRRGREGDDPSWIRLDPSKLRSPVVRSAREGDKILLFGKSVSISSLASSWKVRCPLHEIPVLEDRSGILAVFGAKVGGRERIATACKSLAPENLFVYYWC